MRIEDSKSQGKVWKRKKLFYFYTLDSKFWKIEDGKFVILTKRTLGIERVKFLLARNIRWLCLKAGVRPSSQEIARYYDKLCFPVFPPMFLATLTAFYKRFKSLEEARYALRVTSSGNRGPLTFAIILLEWNIERERKKDICVEMEIKEREWKKERQKKAEKIGLDTVWMQLETFTPFPSLTRVQIRRTTDV